MRWFRIPKASTVPPPTGTYRQWKPQLAEEGRRQCVYCALPDYRFGGVAVFHVEHFTPKAIAPERTNSWDNLYYCCPLCNVFKGADWPDSSSAHAYIDPSQVDLCDVFRVTREFSVEGDSTAARYMIERLFLNRPQLVVSRKEYAVLAEFDRAKAELEEIIGSMLAAGNDGAGLRPVLESLLQLADTLAALLRSPLYSLEDVRRQ